MPQYLSPGLYVEEVNSGSKPISAVGTSVAAFVGFTEKRPEGNNGEPFLVTNWTQFVEAFGGFIPGAYLPLSVYGYFLNGGSICYIQSIMTMTPAASNGSTAPSSEPTVLQLPGKSVPALEVQPIGTSAITVVVQPPSGGAEDQFKLVIRSADGTEETYDDLSLAPTAKNNAVKVVNRSSKLVKLKDLNTTAALPDRQPTPGTYELAAIQPVAAPTSTALSTSTFEGDITARVGIMGLEVADEVTMVCAPDLMSGYVAGTLTLEDVQAVQLAIMNHCELMKDRVAILDAPPDMTPQRVNEWRMKEANYDSKYAALYYPWIYVANPLASNGGPSLIKIPPSGHLAGLYARVDTERGVHKAPANEILRGVVKLETQVTKGEQDILNPNSINCIRSFPGAGIRVWGARTLSSDPTWRYINVRRLFCMLEESLLQGLQWTVFEPNDPGLWARVTRTIDSFLTNIWRTGALFGGAPAEAFFVKCDAELNPPSSRDLGMLVVEVGVAPVKPAEFVVVRIGQMELTE